MQDYIGYMSLNPTQLRAARRVRTLRELMGLKQEDLAAAIGFENRQTLASVEAGDRPLAPTELAAAARALHVTVDRLVDPFQLVGEGEFNFRAAEGVEEATVRAFQESAGRWVATYRELVAQEGVPPRALGLKLELPDRPSYEEVQSAAETLWKEWDLGDAPATRLEEALEARLGVLVLYVDAPEGVSGAAVQLPGLQAILVNRAEPEGRRSYDVAHELFHILTWDAFRPDWIERIEPKRVKGSRVEQLANNFAAALLMPSTVIAKRWCAPAKVEVADWLIATAQSLRVSTAALGWRLVNLGMLPKNEWLALAGRDRAAAAQQAARPVLPRLFNTAFVNRLHSAVEAGRLSLGRAATLLGLSMGEFAALCREHGRSLSYDFGA